MVINHDIVLDVARSNDRTVIKAKQHDANSRTVTVSLYNNGEALTVPQDCGIVVNALRQDGQTAGWAGAVLENGSVLVPLTSWLLEIEGYGDLSVSVISPARERLTSFTFGSYTQKVEWTGEGIEDDPNYDILLTLIADTEAAKAGAIAAALAANNAADAATEAADDATNAADAANAAATAANTATAAAEAATQEAHAAVAATFEMLRDADAYIHEQVDTAVDAAEEATGAANDAAELANGKAELADEKAAAAATAAALAETKAGDANTAAGSANAAAALANEKAGTANTAAGAANTAAALANEKAALAAEKAALAETKAGLAETKAGAADSAATAANTAAAAADTARAGIQGDLAAIGARIDLIETIQEKHLDLSTQTEYGVAINSTNYQWAASNENKCWIVPLPSGLKTITIEANDSYNAVYAFLTSTDHEDGSTPDYATGSGRTIITPGNSQTISTIPADATHIYIQKVYKPGSTTYLNTPDAVVFAAILKTPAIDDSLTNAGQAADAKAAGDRMTAIRQALYRTESVVYANEAIYATLISSESMKWASYSSGGRQSYIIIVPANAKAVTITANSSNGTSYAQLKTAAHQNGADPKWATGASRQSVAAGSSVTIDLASDCHYLWVLKAYNNVSYEPASIVWTIRNTNEAPPLGLHTMPNNAGVMNVVKRCRQFTDIKWTPGADLPRFMKVYQGWPVPDTALEEHFEGLFRAGRVYTGLPYGRADRVMNEYGYEHSEIGYEISFETFITSAENPNSKFCKESAYYKQNHESTIYAVICGVLVSYAFNLQPRKSDANIQDMATMHSIGKLNDNGTHLSLDKLQLGDCLSLQRVHVAVISDLIRDAAGEVVAVEISDASTVISDKDYADGDIGGVCRRKVWPAAMLYENWGNYTVLRYENIADVPYTPSPYVNVGDELDMFRLEHYPVMPYEGNAFLFHSDSIPNDAIKLIINTTDYAFLRIFKDGTELTGSPIQLEANADHYDVTTIDAGDYTAYLCDMSDGDVTYMTVACKWTIEDDGGEEE